jgi:integration host factor subunit beta
VDALIEDGRVELRNFGVFELRYRKARNGRNLHTGKKITVPGRYAVILKPGKAVEKRISEVCREETVGREVPE